MYKYKYIYMLHIWYKYPSGRGGVPAKCLFKSILNAFKKLPNSLDELPLNSARHRQVVLGKEFILTQESLRFHRCL